MRNFKYLYRWDSNVVCSFLDRAEPGKTAPSWITSFSPAETFFGQPGEKHLLRVPWVLNLEIPVSSFSQIWVRALSWFCLSPADQPSAMLQGFQHSPNSMISTQGPCSPCLMPRHKPTHPLTPGSSHTAAIPLFSHSAQAHFLQGPSLYPDAHSWHSTLHPRLHCWPILAYILDFEWVGGIQQSGGASRQEDRGLTEV